MSGKKGMAVTDAIKARIRADVAGYPRDVLDRADRRDRLEARAWRRVAAAREAGFEAGYQIGESRGFHAGWNAARRQPRIADGTRPGARS